MGALIPVCFADMFVVKAFTALALVLVAYLYWTGLRDKLERRRQRKWHENKRREHEKRAAQKVAPPGTP